jgi:outer membrane protein assembly factor BamB
MRLISHAAVLAIALLLSTPNASGQWSAFHGNAQRDGTSDAVGPTAPHLAWVAPIGGPIISSPILGPDGTIYLGSVLEDTLHPRYWIVAVAPDGTRKWRFPTGFVDRQTLSSPAIGRDGTIHVGAQDGTFYAIRPDGSLRWKHQSAKAIQQHPVIAPDGTIYVAIEGRLTAFSPDGAILWQSTQNDMTFPGGPSLAADGTIYIGGGTYGMQSKLYAFAPNGSLDWTAVVGDGYFFPLAPPAVGPDGTIFTYTTGLYAIRPDGALKWVRELSYGDNHYGSAAVDAQGNIYYAGFGAIWKLDASGGILWEHQILQGNFIGSSWSSPLVDAAGNVFVGLGTGNRWDLEVERQLLVLRPNGTKLWSYTLPKIPTTSAPAMASDGTVYIGCLDGNLYAFRP